MPWSVLEKQLATEVQDAIDQSPEGKLNLYALKRANSPALSGCASLAGSANNGGTATTTPQSAPLASIPPPSPPTLFHVVDKKCLPRELTLERFEIRVIRANLKPLKSVPSQPEGTENCAVPSASINPMPAASVNRKASTVVTSHTTTPQPQAVNVSNSPTPGDKSLNSARRVTRAARGGGRALSRVASTAPSEADEETLAAFSSDAVRTPEQAAAEVRTMLQRTGSFSRNSVTGTTVAQGGSLSVDPLHYLRLPMLPTFGTEFFATVDAYHKAAHDAFSDPTTHVVVGVSSADSLFCGALIAITWAFETAAAKEEKEKAALAAAAEAQSRNETPATTKAVSHSNPYEKLTADLSTSKGEDCDDDSSEDDSAPHASQPNDPSAASPFAGIQRLARENPRLDLRKCIEFVDNVLQRMGMRTSLYDSIELCMRSAQYADSVEAARAWAQYATCALERYITLILFYAFLRVVQEQRAMMSVMQIDSFSFRQFMTSRPELQRVVDDLNPWEGRSEFCCPIGIYDAALRGAFRWRRNYWMHGIG